MLPVWITPQAFAIIKGTDGSTYPVYPEGADLAIYAGSAPPTSLDVNYANSVVWYEVLA